MDIRDNSGGIEFRVRVTPRASRNAIEGVHNDVQGGAIKVRVTAPPADGRANEAVRRLLAERLNVGVSAVRIVAGEQSRTKRVAVAGVTAAQVRNLIEPKQTKGGKPNA